MEVWVDVKLVGFVDDVRNSTNLFGQDDASLEHLIHAATNDSQLWHDLLLVCIHSLELPKCGHHTVAYELDPTGRPNLIDSLTHPSPLQMHLGMPSIYPNGQTVKLQNTWAQKI
jgi:hypothetical protein